MLRCRQVQSFYCDLRLETHHVMKLNPIQTRTLLNSAASIAYYAADTIVISSFMSLISRRTLIIT